jgi:DNA-binding transcriptional LysR family regulator
MDIHQLEVFYNLVELKSFTKAAGAVGLTQPTVSELIRSMEESLGERLVDRLGREVLPTPAGKVLYRYAQRIIQLRDEALQAVEKSRGILSGSLPIGASTIPGTYILPELIGSFKTKYPAIRTKLQILSSAEVSAKVLKGDLEIGLVGANPDDRRILLEEIFSDELVLTVYPEHPLAQMEAVEISGIAKEPFILRETGSGTRTVMSQVLEAHGLPVSQLQVVSEMGGTDAVRQAIKAKIGISILSRRAIAEDVERGSLSVVQLKGIRFLRPIYLAHRKNRQMSPPCIAFVSHLRSNALTR